jgi:hypothetical protein
MKEFNMKLMSSMPACNSLHATAYTPDDSCCETEICHVVVEEGHKIGVGKPGNAEKAALKTVFVYIYIK